MSRGTDRWTPDRREAIRRACLNTTLGRVVRKIDDVLDRKVDQGRPVDEEADAIVQRVFGELAEEVLAGSDSAIYVRLDDTPDTDMQSRTWGLAKPRTPSPELKDSPAP